MKNLIEETPNKKLEGRLKKTLEFVDVGNIINKSILDIGCGYGWFELNVLEKNVKKIIGIEVTKDDLRTSKEYVKDKRVTFTIGRATKLPFKDGTFDTVVCWEVIEHIPKNTEEIFFSEVYRVLKKKGAFYLSTPHNSFFSTYTDPAFWLIGHRHYSRSKLTDFGKKHNFSVEKVEILGGFWTVLSSLNMYISKWVFRRKRFFNDFFAKKDDIDYQVSNGFYNIFVKYTKN